MRTVKTIVVPVCLCDRVGCGAEIPEDTEPVAVMGVTYDLCGNCRRDLALAVEGFMQSSEVPEAEPVKVSDPGDEYHAEPESVGETVPETPAEPVPEEPRRSINEIAKDIAERVVQIVEEDPSALVQSVDMSPEAVIKDILSKADGPMSTHDIKVEVEKRGVDTAKTTVHHYLCKLAATKVLQIHTVRGRKAWSLREVQA